MRVRVLFFAMLREQVGASRLELEVPPGTTVGSLEKQFFPADGASSPGGRLLYAVNREYVSRDHALRDGDEVGFIPPVSGG